MKKLYLPISLTLLVRNLVEKKTRITSAIIEQVMEFSDFSNDRMKLFFFQLFTQSNFETTALNSCSRKEEIEELGALLINDSIFDPSFTPDKADLLSEAEMTETAYSMLRFLNSIGKISAQDMKRFDMLIGEKHEIRPLTVINFVDRLIMKNDSPVYGQVPELQAA